METTTIKLYPKTKQAIDDIRLEHETYDQAISRLVMQTKKKNLVKELIAGYKAKAEEDIKTAQEWDAASDVE